MDRLDHLELDQSPGEQPHRPAGTPGRRLGAGDGDQPGLLRPVEGAVLAGWAKRCGVECAKEWNETVGKLLGLKAPAS